MNDKDDRHFKRLECYRLSMRIVFIKFQCPACHVLFLCKGIEILREYALRGFSLLFATFISLTSDEANEGFRFSQYCID